MSVMTGIVTVLVVAASVLTTCFSRAAEKEPETQLFSDCRRILEALRAYSSDHDGEYPADLQALVTEGFINSDDAEHVLKIPTEKGGKPGHWILFPDLNDDSAHWLVLVASPPVRISTNGPLMRILGMNDGSVSLIRDSEFEKVLNEKGQKAPVKPAGK